MRAMANRESKRLLAAAMKAGWRVREAKAGAVVYPPDGSRPIALHAAHRGGFRGTPNATVQLRRAGLDV